MKRPAKKKKNPTWTEIRTSIKGYDRTQMLNLVRDLYNTSEDNKIFLHARFSPGHDSLAPYKKIIKKALYPDTMNDKYFDFFRAEQLINLYAKASGDTEGTADLMIYYVECGNKFTLDYGDIDEVFYDALVKMYDRAIKTVLKIPKKNRDIYKKRLKKIMKSSDGIGWGYHDDIADLYFEAFGEN